MDSSNGGDAFDDGSSGAAGYERYLAEGFPLAYVRPVRTDKGLVYGVFSADGMQLALFSSRDAAYYSAKQHDLEPVLIH